MQHDAIAVIDFGGQYAHLIATKVRRLKVLAEIRQPEDPPAAFALYKGIIISGSPALSSHGEDSAYDKRLYDLDIPILGFCFGHQEIAKHYGGRVEHGKQEWGRAQLHLLREHPLFAGLDRREQVWMSHFDSVTALGPDFEELGFTVLGEEPGGRARPAQHRFAAIGSDKRRRYGLQFHPEVDDTVHGDKMIANFIFGICGCTPSWTMDSYLAEQVETIRRQVGERSVFLLASGGVDSTVAARLIGEALGPGHLQLLHIDNGLMRRNESRHVLAAFAAMGLDRNLHFVDAGATFLAALSGVVDPEAKRRIIGTTFVEVFESEAGRLGITDHLLGQGTIYPDTIETGGTKRADTIKTHHNRVPIIEEMIAAGRVIEPLADLYKVEVRELGAKLGIDERMIWRHPFPGPGLGVRLLCSDGKLPDTESLDRIAPDVAEIAGRHGLAGIPLPIKSVGVKADLRSYENPVLLHGAVDIDSQTGWDSLLSAAGAIFKSVLGINRCLWNLAPEMPARFTPLAATMTRERLDLLREADDLVMEGLRRTGLYRRVWQCPTVFVPARIDGRGQEFCIIRPIHSERAMTATPARLPQDLLMDLRERILALPNVSGFAYDITTKPPGTIEWE
jgi:GMP synthase (glutamine-hydrolysing)